MEPNARRTGAPIKLIVDGIRDSATSDKRSTTRHSIASRLLKAGAPITSIRDLLGHAEVTTANRHAHSVEDAREVIGRLEHLEGDASPRKQEGDAETEVRQKRVFAIPFGISIYYCI